MQEAIAAMIEEIYAAFLRYGTTLKELMPKGKEILYGYLIEKTLDEINENIKNLPSVQSAGSEWEWLKSLPAWLSAKDKEMSKTAQEKVNKQVSEFLLKHITVEDTTSTQPTASKGTSTSAAKPSAYKATSTMSFDPVIIKGDTAPKTPAKKSATVTKTPTEKNATVNSSASVSANQQSNAPLIQKENTWLTFLKTNAVAQKAIIEERNKQQVALEKKKQKELADAQLTEKDLQKVSAAQLKADKVNSTGIKGWREKAAALRALKGTNTETVEGAKALKEAIDKETKAVEENRKQVLDNATSKLQAAQSCISASSKIVEASKGDATAKKAVAMGEAAVNTALAATNALKTDDPVSRWIQFGAILVEGVAQQVIIAKQKFALGTNYAPGGMSLVGEQGPELVNLPRGSQVYSNSTTGKMLANSSNNTHFHIYNERGDLAQEIITQTRKGGSMERAAKLLVAAAGIRA